MIDEAAGPNGSPPVSPSVRRLGGFGCAGALLAAAGGGLGAWALLDTARSVLAFGGRPSPLSLAADVSVSIILGLLGLIAVVTGLNAVQRTRDGALGAPRLFERSGAGRPMLVFVLALAAGQLVLLRGAEDGLLLALAHPLAAIMPALAIIGAIAFEQRGATPRHVVGGLAWGSVFATTFAFIAEMFFLAIITFVLYLGLRSTADGQAVIELVGGLVREIARSPETFDPELIDPSSLGSLTALAIRPSFILAAYALFGMLGPGAEELAKVAGVAILRPRDRSRAFLTGAACGAGFGIVEALLLGAAGLGPGWAAAMLVRVFSTLMHAMLSGIAGIGWYEIAVERRWLAGVTGIGAAIIGHAAWNSLVLTAVLAGIASQQLGGTPATVASAISLAAPLGLVMLVFIFLRRLRVTSAELGVKNRPKNASEAPFSGSDHAIVSLSGASPTTPSEDR